MWKKFSISFVLLSINLTFAYSQCALKIVDKTVNFGMRPTLNRTINAVIIHSTYNASGGDKYDIEGVIGQFKLHGVSAHYIIGREGTIYQLVKEKDISFQAGRSSLPDGRTDVNGCSIGIEIISTKDSLDSPTEKQIKSLTHLVNDIRSRHKIKYVLRHSDIAPDRKTDPWNMDWDDFLKRINVLNKSNQKTRTQINDNLHES